LWTDLKISHSSLAFAADMGCRGCIVAGGLMFNPLLAEYSLVEMLLREPKNRR
jgi:hypothetical protein